VTGKAAFRSPMTMDRGQQRLTLVVTFVVVAAAVASFWSSVAAGRGLRGASFALIISPVMLFAWAMAPSAVVVDADELRIERRAWRALRVERWTIEGVSSVALPSRGAIRLFGVGGFFGSYGLFSSRALGRFRLYATRSGPAVLIRRSGGRLPLVLTPDDLEGAVRALEVLRG
jgi:hypothetical protein